MKINLIVAAVLAVLVLPEADGKEYRGRVGGLEATYQLEWGSDDTVDGTYAYPSRPNTTYRLRGHNREAGKLYLEEFTGSKLTAKCYLTKKLSDDRIVWSGRMHNTDGRVFDMDLSRPKETAAAPSTPSSGSSAEGATAYSGNVGRLAARFSLDWQASGRVSGTYDYPSRPGVTYRLEGRNPKQGELYLEEYTGNVLTARCYLSKRLTSGRIVWEGRMKNTDGRQFEMALSRGRESETPDAWEAPRLSREQELLRKLAPEVAWNGFPEADVPVEMVPVSWGSSTVWMNAKVVGYEGHADHAVLQFVLASEQSVRSENARYTGPKVTLRIGRSLPFTSENMLGSVIGVTYDSSGELASVYLHSVAVTHWRNSATGKVEIRGVLSSPAADDLHRLSAAEKARVIRSLPSVAFVPDKLASNALEDPDFTWRGIRVTRRYGLTVQMTDAGPGGLELESISLEAPASEAPWNFVGDRGTKPSIPSTQSTGEAG